MLQHADESLWAGKSKMYERQMRQTISLNVSLKNVIFDIFALSDTCHNIDTL